MSFISLKNVNKKFGDKVVLENFSLDIEKNEKIAIMGPSGCGKTTLIRIISGFEKADFGEISGDFSKISFVFQEDRLCEDFSAVSNIKFVTGDSVPKAKILETLDSLGLKEFANSPVKTMSGGMKRRVAIARALLADGDALILDEPFKGLDDELKTVVMQFIKEKTKDKTVILVSHDNSEAEYLCDRIINL